MTHYTVLIDGEAGAYGVVFPDLSGCSAMGDTIEEALNNAQEALRAWAETYAAKGQAMPVPRGPDAIRSDPLFAEDFSSGAMFGTVMLVQRLGRPQKANLSIDSGILAAIDETANRLGVTRSAMVEMLAEDKLPEFA
ncbi:type II toxin-antitoxin system HicB family antitoxin [Brevundimonas sp.]|uniref:type II toxin-antitoxin system HicB family antitoxin n=1 Tax=Brevundimonas sp. TaxID=1871086 RepID=UPI003D129716